LTFLTFQVVPPLALTLSQVHGGRNLRLPRHEAVSAPKQDEVMKITNINKVVQFNLWNQ
jgi:hypothetical protein